MDDDFTSILRDGAKCHSIEDGIYDFLGDERLGDEKETVRSFYDEWGWHKSGDDSLYNDTALFVATGSTAREYTRQCNLSIGRQVARGGRYLLDAGCGAIAWPEALDFDAGYQARICVDVSRRALVEAKRKLGDRGRYLRADLTRLPLKDGVVDGAVACHVLYHVPAGEQRLALTELARVLAADARAAVVYAWRDPPLPALLAGLFESLAGAEASGSSIIEPEHPPLYYHAHSLEWFQSQDWPFSYEILPFRLINNGMMRRFFRDTPRWQSVVGRLLDMQSRYPEFCGKYGQYPLIVLKRT